MCAMEMFSPKRIAAVQSASVTSTDASRLHKGGNIIRHDIVSNLACDWLFPGSLPSLNAGPPKTSAARQSREASRSPPAATCLPAGIPDRLKIQRFYGPAGIATS